MTRIQSRTLLLAIAAGSLWMTMTTAVDATATAGISDTTVGGGLRSNSNHQDTTSKRQSVIRRLYGPENGSVRKHVRLLEEQSPRSQTGFLGDPDHKVPYHNHPYDPESETYVGRRHRQQRQLQDENTSDGAGYPADDPTTTEDDTAVKDLYQPLRIKFVTASLDSMRSEDNAAKIDFIKTQILPA